MERTNATELPRLGSARMKLSVQASQTVAPSQPTAREQPTPGHAPVLVGDLLFGSTLWKNLWPGMAPSRANAYIIRLLDVTENVPQKNIAPITIT